MSSNRLSTADKAEQTHRVATAAIEAEIKARDAKTERLKAARLALESQARAAAAAEPRKASAKASAKAPAKATAVRRATRAG